MSKTVPPLLQAHLQGEVTTLATIWQITRTDGVIRRLTDHDQDLVVDGETYIATYGYTRTAISNSEGLQPDDLDLQLLIDNSLISEVDVKTGAYNGAELRISAVNWAAPEQGTMALKRGYFGEVFYSDQGRASVEFRSLLARLQQTVLEKTSPLCRAELGDARCTVPIVPALRQNVTAYTVGQFIRVPTAPGLIGQSQFENRIYECVTAGTSAAAEPTYDTIVGNTTTDGTAQFICREAWTRHASVLTVTDRRTFTVNLDEPRAVDGWFNLGSLTWESGANAGRIQEIKDWQLSTGTITLFLEAPFDIQPGDVLLMKPGCDKRRATCRNKWVIDGSANFATGNVINMRAEPDLPGRDAVLTYPDAQ